jgi:hypothetical protein
MPLSMIHYQMISAALFDNQYNTAGAAFKSNLRQRWVKRFKNRTNCLT